MHPLSQTYVSGIDAALTSFGMDKEAIDPAQKAKMMAAFHARPKGLAAIQAASTPVPRAAVANVPQATAGYAAPGAGGPGMDPRFAQAQAGRAVSLQTPPIVAEKNRALLGQSLYGQPLRQAASAGPVALHPGRNVLGSLLLPWPE